MKYLKIFDDFVNHLYEIRYTDHWMRRTSYPNDVGNNISRILPYSDNFKYGFKISYFINEKGEEFPLSEALSLLEINMSELEKYLSEALRILTRNEELERWESKSTAHYLMLELGRVCFVKYYDTMLYPVIKGSDGDSDFYDEGDVVWGMVKENKKGITIKYYPSGDSGLITMRTYAEREARRKDKISSSYFIKNSYVDYPYGKNFCIIVDLNLNDERSIISDIRHQLERHRVG